MSKRRIELLSRILRRILRNKYILLLRLVLKRFSFFLPSLLVRKILIRAFRRIYNSCRSKKISYRLDNYYEVSRYAGGIRLLRLRIIALAGLGLAYLNDSSLFL